MSSQTLILKDVRLFWADLFHPAADSTDEKTGQVIKGKYTATLIFDPASDAGKAAQAAFQKAAADEFGANWAKVVEAIDPKKKCIKKGDHKLDKDGNVYPGFEGQLYLAAKNTVKPVVVDSYFTNGKPTPIDENSGRIYRGCYVNAKIEISAFTSKNPAVGRMIGAKVLAVQFARDGEAFGAAQPTADGFEDLGGAPALSDGLTDLFA